MLLFSYIGAATHPHKRTNRTNGAYSSHIPLYQAPTIAFSSLGYAILLEKPMAVTEEDCKAILDACVANKTILAVGHVLRYTPHVRTITDLIRTGYVHIYAVVWISVAASKVFFRSFSRRRTFCAWKSVSA
jgi:predicted dehydrogenase